MSPPRKKKKSNTQIPFQWVPLDQITELLGYKIPGGFYTASSIDQWSGEPSTITLEFR